jgi:hypothetical protein
MKADGQTMDNNEEICYKSCVIHLNNDATKHKAFMYHL